MKHYGFSEGSIATVPMLNNATYKIISQIFRLFPQKYLQKYDHLQPPEGADFHHGGHDYEPSHIF